MVNWPTDGPAAKRRFLGMVNYLAKFFPVDGTEIAISDQHLSQIAQHTRNDTLMVRLKTIASRMANRPEGSATGLDGLLSHQRQDSCR